MEEEKKEEEEGGTASISMEDGQAGRAGVGRYPPPPSPPPASPPPRAFITRFNQTSSW